MLQTITNSGSIGADTGSGTIATTIPSGIPAGSYHVLVKIDSGNVVAETDETNNVFVSPAADIVIPAPVVPPAPQPVKIGSPDPNYGTQGLAVHDVGITTTAPTLPSRPTAKSVIVGARRRPTGAGDFALTRYTANGGLDTTFGNQGQVTTGVSGGDDQAAAVDILPDGRASSSSEPRSAKSADRPPARNSPSPAITPTDHSTRLSATAPGWC